MLVKSWRKDKIRMVLAILFVAACLFVNVSTVSAADECTSILPPEWCDGGTGDGVWQILGLVLNIMTAGVGIAATVGLVISGIQWMTARDKEDQIVKAKNRIFNIVIGILVWGLAWIVLEWLLPGGIL